MMKFHLFYVLTMCIWLGQICADDDNVYTEKYIRENLYAVSDQFVADFMQISEHYRNNRFIQDFFAEVFWSIKVMSGSETKISVNRLKDFTSKIHFPREVAVFECVQILQSILSKQFPAERYNGVVNLIFITLCDNATTTEEIQSALNYLYGIDNDATKISFIDTENRLKLALERDCAASERMASTNINTLRSYVEVKPLVWQNLLAIRDGFPCSLFFNEFLDKFIILLRELGCNERKIDACRMRQYAISLASNPRSKRYRISELESVEPILSSRLPDETIRGIINLQKATIFDMPIDEIEEALKYLYDDVTKTDCPTTESSTLEA